MNKKTLTPVAAVLGTTFAVSLATSPIAQADENPFAMNELANGYMVVAEGNCGEKGEEGKCGDKEEGEGKCGDKGESKGEGEGKCGS